MPWKHFGGFAGGLGGQPGRWKPRQHWNIGWALLSDHAAPDEPLVAVLLDGPGWYSRRTVADRDGLPVDVLSDC